MNGRVVARALGILPVSVRRAVIGSVDNPSWFANFAHKLLNRLPVNRDEALDCQGDLEGFRMYTEWKRYRGVVYGSWEPEVSAIVKKSVQKGMTALDVGGHIGYYTLLLARLVGPDGRVFSFEPSPDNFEFLEKNVRINALAHVSLSRKALFSRAGTFTMTIPDAATNSGGASIVHAVGSASIAIETMTLDSFCEGNAAQPAFVKMDVEGAEYDVLIGGEKTIRTNRPKMLIELHHFDGNIGGHPVPALLKSWGYEVEWIERFPQTSHIFAAG